MENYQQYALFHLILFCFCDHVSSAELSDHQLQTGSYIDFYHQPSETVTFRGRPFHLDCEVGLFSSGYIKLNVTLPSNIIWYKDNKRLPIENGVFQRRTLLENGSLSVYEAVHNLDDDSDIGFYKCQVEYQNKILVSQTAQLKVAVFGRHRKQRISSSKCVGENLRWNCTFANSDPSLVVAWYKDGTKIGENRMWKYNTKTSSFVARKPGPGMAPVDAKTGDFVTLPTGALEISSLSSKHAGTYSCAGEIDGVHKQGYEFTLRINSECSSESNVRFLVQPTPKTATIGESSLLECSVSSLNADSSIKWFKNATQIDFRPNGPFSLLGQGNLLIENVTTAAEAEYFCVIDELQPPLVSSTTLTILVPPHIVEPERHKVYAYVGCLIDFPCNVSGKPIPSIRWYKDGQLISDSRFSKMDGRTVTLQVSGMEDGGFYQCFAENSCGQDHLTYQLQVLSQDASVRSDTEPTDELVLEELTSSSALLSWPQSFGVFPRTKYKISVFDIESGRHNLLKSNLARVKLTDLTPGHSVRVYVVPSTDLCDGVSSREMTFTVPSADSVTGAVQNFFAEALSPTSIRLSWIRPPFNNSIDRDIQYKIKAHEIDGNRKLQDVTVKQSPYLFTGLKKYTSYAFKIAVVIPSGGVGPYSSQIVSKTRKAAPELPPSNITVDAESSISALVHWDHPPHNSINGPLLGYRIRYRDTYNRKTSYETAGPSDNQFLLKGLRRNTEYSVRMRTVSSEGVSPPSRRFYFETLKKELRESSAPGKPASLDTQRKSTEIIVFWDPPLGDVHVREYIIGWGINGPYEHTQRLGSDLRYFKITDLKPSTQYFISIRAGNKVGLGMKYHTVARTVADTVQELYPPLGVHVTSLTDTTLNVSWHDSDRDKGPRYYVLRYKTNVPEEPRVRIVNSSDVTCLIHGLRPHTLYEVSVKVVQGNRKSPWSMSALANTKESKPGSAPTDLTVLSMDGDPSTLQLNWQPPEQPNGELNGYLVFYTTDKTQDIRKWVVEPAPGGGLSTTIHGLTDDTQYYFKVLASNTHGSGPYSSVVEFRTPKTDKDEEDTTAPFNMATWVWYVIIGGVGLLVVIVLLIATIMVCRSRKATLSSKPLHQRNGFPHSAGNGLRSASHSSWATPVSVGLLHQDDYVENQPLRREGLFMHDYPYYRCSSEMMPLNGTSYTRGYPFASQHSKMSDYHLKSHATSSGSDSYHPNGRYDSVAMPQPTPDQYDLDYYAPSDVAPSPQDYAGDSAYSSDHQHYHVTEDCPITRYGKSTSRNRQLSGGLPPSDRSSPLSDSLDSARHSTSLSVGSDEVNSQLANIEECVKDLKATQGLSGASVQI